jgi:hypothetical protein
MNKINLFFAVTLFVHISFATEFVKIDDTNYVEISDFYVEQVLPDGSIINDGWTNKPGLNDSPGEAYFVYGLTNLVTGKNYEAADRIVGVVTNEYYYSKTIKGPAFVLLPPAEQDRIAKIAKENTMDKSNIRQDYLKALQQANAFGQAEKAFRNVAIGATNGSASCQFELGDYYLNGMYPAETNTALGLYWIKIAAANNNKDAKLFLENIK